MSGRDKCNLEFLLSISEDAETFNDFVESLSLDDVYYAIELLQGHAATLMMNELESIDDIKDCSLADSILTKIKENIDG